MSGAEGDPSRRAGDPARLLTEAAALLGESDRPDLERRLRVGAARLSRPATVIAVVGEFKQGKSELVNALVGRRVCPVDVDLATCAVTVLYHAGEPTGRVRRKVDGDAVVEPVSEQELADLVSERGNPGNERQVETAEVGLPSPFLERGITLVDTPGVGGVTPGRAGSLLSFLPIADAVVLVTDASAELTASEIRFLEEARVACPTVVVALTKIDLHAHWRRIRELDEGHLAAAGIEAPVIAVSASLELLAGERADAALAAESGMADLAEVLATGVAAAARTQDAARAASEVIAAVEEAASPLRAEREALVEDRATTVERLRVAREDLAAAQAGASRWSTVLQDGVADLRTDTDYEIRSRMRALVHQMEHLVDEADPLEEWDRIAEELRHGLVDSCRELFDRVNAAGEEIARRIAGLLPGDDGVAATGLRPIAVPGWAVTDEAPAPAGKGAISSGLEVLRGSYGGILLIGMVARLVSLPLMGPAAIGVGAVFGAKQFADMRKRRLEQRRAESKQALRRFLDEASLDLGRQVRHLVQGLQRDLRDRFAARIAERVQTLSATVEALQRSVDAAENARRTNLPVVEQRLAALDAITARAVALLEAPP